MQIFYWNNVCDAGTQVLIFINFQIEFSNTETHYFCIVSNYLFAALNRRIRFSCWRLLFLPPPNHQMHIDSRFSASKSTTVATKRASHTALNAAAWIIVHFSGARTHKSYAMDLQVLITPPGFPTFSYSGQNSTTRLWPFPPCCHSVCSRESWNEKQWKVHHSWTNTQHLMWRVVATWGHLGRLLTRFLIFRFALNVSKLHIFQHIPYNQSRVPLSLKSTLLNSSSWIWWFSTLVVMILVVYIFIFNPFIFFQGRTNGLKPGNELSSSPPRHRQRGGPAAESCWALHCSLVVWE